MEEKSKFQKFIFEKTLMQFKKTSDAVLEISKLLDLHPDRIYKRLRGDALLTPEEIEKIVLKYKISVDTYFFKDTDMVSFQFNPFIKTIKNFDDYINELNNAVTPLSELKGITLHSSSSDLPLFYFLSSPALFSFKMFEWARSVWNFEHIQKEKFSLHLISPSTHEKAREIWELYREQNTVEMWSLNILDSTLNQIEFYYFTKLLRGKKDALKLCEALFDLVSNLELMVTEGKKITKGNLSKERFKLYHNEINYTNNTILIESDTIDIVYCNFVIPDYLRTTDERIVKYTQNWFNDIISKSTEISSQGKKGRQYFFENLFDKIARLKQRIENN